MTHLTYQEGATSNWNYISSNTAGTLITQDYLTASTGSDYSGYRIYNNQKWTTDFTANNHQYETFRVQFHDYYFTRHLVSGGFISPAQPKPLSPEELKKQEEEAKKERERMLKAQETAHELLELLVPEEKLVQLKKERRIEIIARNNKIYEILDDGRVNQLLPDGKKQGLCINVTNGPYPADDIILAKLLLLENDPEKLEEIANKVSPFQLVAMPV